MAGIVDLKLTTEVAAIEFGEELMDIEDRGFEAGTVGNWIAYGTNTIVSTSDQADEGIRSLHLTYIDHNDGAYLTLNQATGLLRDTVQGSQYRLQMATRIGDGPNTMLRVFDGSNYQESPEFNEIGIWKVFVLDFVRGATHPFITLRGSVTGGTPRYNNYYDALSFKEIVSESQVEGDLALENYDLVLVDEIDRIRQQLQMKLRLFLGEWYLDIYQGIPYFDDILVKNPDPVRLQSIFKAAIIGVPDVLKLLEFKLELEKSTRQLHLTFKVDTAYGEIEIDGVL